MGSAGQGRRAADVSDQRGRMHHGAVTGLRCATVDAEPVARVWVFFGMLREIAFDRVDAWPSAKVENVRNFRHDQNSIHS